LSNVDVYLEDLSMNIRSLLVLLASMTALGLVACTEETETSGSGGFGGSGGGGVGGGGVGGGGVGGGGVGGGTSCDPEYKCAVAITPPDGDPALFCTDSASLVLYDAREECICTTKCSAQCGASYCTGAAPDDACTTCIQDTAAGCGTENTDCANDL
jgi:hypothetical protein